MGRSGQEGRTDKTSNRWDPGVGQGRSLDWDTRMGMEHLHDRRRMCGEMGSFLFLKMDALRKTRER